MKIIKWYTTDPYFDVINLSMASAKFVAPWSARVYATRVPGLHKQQNLKGLRTKTACANSFSENGLEGSGQYADVTRHITLSEDMLSKDAKVELVGMVPDTLIAAHATENNQADLFFPPNSGTTDSKIENRGGAVLQRIRVELVFWGNSWNSAANSTLRAQVTAAISGLVAGPYCLGLREYGVTDSPIWGGATTVISNLPPIVINTRNSTFTRPFDDRTVGNFVKDLIEGGFYPEPHKAGGNNFYCVLMPPGTTYIPGGALGAHSWVSVADAPFSTNMETAWFAWIGFSNLDTITRVFSHELAETCTDPEGKTWRTKKTGQEISDLCNSRRAYLRGVYVEGYWSNKYNACVIPRESSAPITAIARNSNKMNLFVIGYNGAVYTSSRENGGEWSGFNNNWKYIGGIFPVGAPVAAITHTSSNIRLFVVGYGGVVYTSSWSSGADWSGINDNWKPIGGFFPVGAPVTAVAKSVNDYDLFVIGYDGVVYTSSKSIDSEWSGINNNWKPIGGYFPVGATVSAVARTPNDMDLFIVDANGIVATSTWSRGSDWSGIGNKWRQIGGFFPPGAPVTAVARTPNNMDLFVIDATGVVATSRWSSGSDWSGIGDNWSQIGGYFQSGIPVTAVARTGDNMDLFIVDATGIVATSRWSSSSDWSGIGNNWSQIGGFFPAGAPIAAVARSPNDMDLFVVDATGVVATSWWYNGTNWSGIGNNWKQIGGYFPVGLP